MGTMYPQVLNENVDVKNYILPAIVDFSIEFRWQMF